MPRLSALLVVTCMASAVAFMVPTGPQANRMAVRRYASNSKAVLQRFKDIQKQAGLPADVVDAIASDWSQEEIDSLFAVSPAEMEAALGNTAKQIGPLTPLLTKEVWKSWIEEARKNASGGKASRPLGVRPSWYMDFDVREMAKRFLRDEVTKAGVGGSKLLFQTDAQLEAEARGFDEFEKRMVKEYEARIAIVKEELAEEEKEIAAWEADLIKYTDEVIEMTDNQITAKFQKYKDE